MLSCCACPGSNRAYALGVSSLPYSFASLFLRALLRGECSIWLALAAYGLALVGMHTTRRGLLGRHYLPAFFLRSQSATAAHA